MPDNPAKPPRFPYVGALLCVACVGAAVWLWMMYSYAWDVTAEQLYEHRWPRGMGLWQGAYLQVNGAPSMAPLPVQDPGPFTKHEFPLSSVDIWVQVSRDIASPPLGTNATFRGRAVFVNRHFGRNPFDHHSSGGHVYVTIDATVGRFHPASIAGLVVCAMGVFVFTVALRHWLGKRRKLRQEATA